MLDGQKDKPMEEERRQRRESSEESIFYDLLYRRNDPPSDTEQEEKNLFETEDVPKWKDKITMQNQTKKKNKKKNATIKINFDKKTMKLGKITNFRDNKCGTMSRDRWFTQEEREQDGKTNRQNGNYKQHRS